MLVLCLLVEQQVQVFVQLQLLVLENIDFVLAFAEFFQLCLLDEDLGSELLQLNMRL